MDHIYAKKGLSQAAIDAAHKAPEGSFHRPGSNSK